MKTLMAGGSESPQGSPSEENSPQKDWATPASLLPQDQASSATSPSLPSVEAFMKADPMSLASASMTQVFPEPVQESVQGAADVEDSELLPTAAGSDDKGKGLDLK